MCELSSHAFSTVTRIPSSPTNTTSINKCCIQNMIKRKFNAISIPFLCSSSRLYASQQLCSKFLCQWYNFSELKKNERLIKIAVLSCTVLDASSSTRISAQIKAFLHNPKTSVLAKQALLSMLESSIRGTSTTFLSRAS